MSHRVVLITGANGGLGLAIAEAFLNEGSDRFVWLGIHHKRSDAENLASRFLGRVRTVELDVTDPRAWELAVDSISQTNQRLDVLINNAGFHADSLLGQMTFENWRRVLAVNLDGTFLGCQAALPLMISQRGGRIVNIASLSALAAPPGQTNYAAAKAGVVALTQSLAKEVARIGITVNAVCPGYTDTESLALMGSDARKAAVAKTPMRRFGKPEEVASAVRYLASPEASYITGSILKVDGGILQADMDMNDTLKGQLKAMMVETLMLQVTADKIGDDQILFGPDSLGLDSVDALQLVVALDKNFGLKIANPGEAKLILQSVNTIAGAVQGLQAKSIASGG